MKKNTFFTRLFFYSIISSATLFSCQNEELEAEQAKGLSSIFSTASIENAEIMLLDYEDCNAVCLEEGISTYYKISGSDSAPSGPNTKEVSYEAYNTATEFIVNVTYDIISGTSNSKADITIDIDGNIVVLEDIAKGSTVSHSITLPADWTACHEISFNILQEGLGSPISFENTYALIGLCNESCEESFSYSANEDESFTFSYITPDALIGAEIKFTLPHVVSYSSLDEKTYTVNPGNGNGSPTVLSWTGDVASCEELTFVIAFEADCDQTNNGFANIFTDFKVNGVSKKGENANITVACVE